MIHSLDRETGKRKWRVRIQGLNTGESWENPSAGRGDFWDGLSGGERSNGKRRGGWDSYIRQEESLIAGGGGKCDV